MAAAQGERHQHQFETDATLELLLVHTFKEHLFLIRIQSRNPSVDMARGDAECFDPGDVPELFTRHPDGLSFGRVHDDRFRWSLG